MTELPRGTVRLNINVDQRLHSSFKAAAALEGKRMTDLLLEFIEQYVREHLPSKHPQKGSKR